MGLLSAQDLGSSQLLLTPVAPGTLPNPADVLSLHDPMMPVPTPLATYPITLDSRQPQVGGCRAQGGGVLGLRDEVQGGVQCFKVWVLVESTVLGLCGGLNAVGMAQCGYITTHIIVETPGGDPTHRP